MAILWHDQIIPYNSGSAVLSADLTVNVGAGQSVGGSDTGELFVSGTLLETVLRDILIKAVHPNYFSPTLILSIILGDLAGNYEEGTIVNSTFNITWTQNDAGPKVSDGLYRNTSLIVTDFFPFEDTNYQLLTGITNYQAIVNYDDGIIKNNNLGNPDPVGRILQNTAFSNIITFHTYRKAFYGALLDGIPVITSAQVRNLPNSILNPSGQNYILNIPVGTVSVVFAIPSTLTLNYVEYLELSNSDIKAAFGITVVLVEGLSGYNPISYNVYTFIPVEPFPVEVNYRIKAT